MAIYIATMNTAIWFNLMEYAIFVAIAPSSCTFAVYSKVFSCLWYNFCKSFKIHFSFNFIFIIFVSNRYFKPGLNILWIKFRKLLKLLMTLSIIFFIINSSREHSFHAICSFFVYCQSLFLSCLEFFTKILIFWIQFNCFFQILNSFIILPCFQVSLLSKIVCF